MAEVETITSMSNPRIKQIRKLRERKEREQTGLYYIEGLKILGEAVESGAALESVYYADELLTHEFGKKLLAEIRKRSVPLIRVSDEVFRSFALKEGPQGIGAVVRQRWLNLDEIEIDRDWVALEAVADPGNLGTILRTNDSVGGGGVILLDHSTDPYEPTAVRASMGSLYSQKLVRTNYETFARWVTQRSIPLIGASGDAAQDYHCVDYPHPMILLMGSEREGMSERYKHLCNFSVSIPMVGRADSLNLSIATAVVLYEIFNKKRSQGETR